MPKSETELFSEALELLRGSLPQGWTVRTRTRQPDLFTRPDAELEISDPDGYGSALLVEVRSSLEAFMVSRLVENWRLVTPDPILVVAPFISSRTREALQLEGINYIDGTGRIRLELDRPGLFIYVETGLKPDRSSASMSGDRPMSTLRGIPATRIVRALCDFRPPYSPSRLAELARTSPASVSRALTLLERENLVEREPRGPVVQADWKGLILRWAEDYSFQTTNGARGCLAPRGENAVIERLRDREGYALTGSYAIPAEARTAPPSTPLIYVPSRIDALEVLEVRPSDKGTNVVIAEPFNPVILDRTRVEDSLVLCSLSQVAVDLLTGPGRSSAEADGLFVWMRENERSWRMDPIEERARDGG